MTTEATYSTNRPTDDFELSQSQRMSEQAEEKYVHAQQRGRLKKDVSKESGTRLETGSTGLDLVVT